MSQQSESEFKNLINEEKSMLWSRALGLTRKSEDAEDLIQDTVLKAYANFERFEQGTNFRAWMNRIMLNTHINNVNRRKNNAYCDFSTGECDTMVYHLSEDDSKTYSNSPEDLFFKRYIDERLEESVFELPDSYRIPFTLYHFEGYRYENIAKMLELPIGTIKSRIFRARRMLRSSAFSKKLQSA